MTWKQALGLCAIGLLLLVVGVKVFGRQAPRKDTPSYLVFRVVGKKLADDPDHLPSGTIVYILKALDQDSREMLGNREMDVPVAPDNESATFMSTIQLGEIVSARPLDQPDPTTGSRWQFIQAAK